MNPSWLPDIRRELYSSESECLRHINNKTFDEKPFEEYFINWDQYYYVISSYPNEKDIYDASNLPLIAKYYNENTNTTNYYDERTGVKKTQAPKYSSNKTTKEIEREVKYKVYPIVGGIVLLIILLLRSCARGESIDKKYVLVDNKGKKIEFIDQNFIPNNTEEVINPMEFPIKTR